MKKTCIIIYIILIFILLKLLISFGTNRLFIFLYDKEIYSESIVKSLLTLNISEPYIAHYNYGNFLYKTNEFEQALEEYKKALKLFPPKYKECSIRINLALAMIAEVDEENKSKDENIEILKNAREELCADGCAGKISDTGHSEEAEKLKKEIDEWIKKLEEQEDNEKNNESNSDEEENKNNQSQMNSKEQQLKEIQAESNQERSEELERYKMINSYEYYSGKKW